MWPTSAALPRLAALQNVLVALPAAGSAAEWQDLHWAWIWEEQAALWSRPAHLGWLMLWPLM